MRITTWMTQQKRLSELQFSQARVDSTQEQVSTGLRLQKPSDDPLAMMELLQISTRLSARQQQGASLKTATPVMQATESALGDIATALLSAKIAAQRAANTATTSPADRIALAAQIHSAAQVILSRANTKVGERYVFGGTASDQAPFVAGDPVTYLGNGASLKVDVAEGQPFEMSITGEQLRAGQGGSELFANLKQLEQEVLTGDSSALQSSLSKVNDNWSHVVELRGDMGARLNYVTMAQDRLEQEITQIQGRQSELRDVDFAQAVVAEKISENSQQATLAMAARLGSASLLDYLR